jgi:hypothetical protein
VARVGGQQRFDELCAVHLDHLSDDSRRNAVTLRSTFARMLEPSLVDLRTLVTGYSDRVIELLACLTVRHRRAAVTSAPPPRIGPWQSLKRALAGSHIGAQASESFPTDGIGASNRPFTPTEFAALALGHGFRMMAYGPDAALCSGPPIVKPIYDGTFNGHDSVWECILERAH